MGEVLAMQQDQQPEFSTDLFQEFWLLYPRRVARIKAERAWKRLTKGERVAALSALVHWRKIWLRRDEMEFTPHPSSWLNGERWEDELPSEYEASVRHASHVPFAKDDAKFVKGEMPEHVKEALAALKEKARVRT